MQMNDWLLLNERNGIEAEFDVLECNKNNGDRCASSTNHEAMLLY
jgi:hypothetical protein